DAGLVADYAHKLYFESAAMILALVTVGKYLEARSKSKTSDALGKLVDLAPKTAVVIRDGTERTIPAEQLTAGDIVVIRPGESIPADGVVTEGHGFVDQSAITGESIPVEKSPGDQVITATINKNG
ncbi:MAG TPA: heavy metal translocating P-type ATPase, partial [Clostridiales bacterium]|nr:heavy metal translocating P-type ATPase [Clostridiales bacterium]